MRSLGETMMRSYEAAPGIEVLASDFGVPGFGLLPTNAFLLPACG